MNWVRGIDVTQYSAFDPTVFRFQNYPASVEFGSRIEAMAVAPPMLIRTAPSPIISVRSAIQLFDS
jgi:hypothetical protein